MGEEEIKQIIQNAENGDGYIQFYLGWCYYWGSEGFEINYEKSNYWNNKAIETFTPKAEQGDINAQFQLGEYYHNGIDKEKADYWLKKAITQCEYLAETGNIYAQKKLAQCFSHGWGVEHNSEKTFYWYNKAAEAGDAEAMWKISVDYKYGLCSLEKNEKTAFELCKRSAELGYFKQWSMGYYYSEENDIIQLDIEKAKDWFAKSAVQGYQEAEYQLQKLNSNRYVNMDETVIPNEVRNFVKISTPTLKQMLEIQYNALEEDYGSEAIIFIPSVQDDLKIIYFNGENCDALDEKISQKGSLRGFHTLKNGLSFWGAIANGDWEIPLFFLVYYDGKNLRGYVPFYGNLINLDTKTAFGSEIETNVENLIDIYPESINDNYFDFCMAYLRKHNAHNVKHDDLEINWNAIEKELLKVFQEKK